METFFSIIIPTYNRAELIEKTIQSVLIQTFCDYEIIVVDDGSTDNTEEVVTSITSSKIIYHKKINAERGAARNTGIDLSKGKYITFLDSDDILYENHLEVASQVIQEDTYVNWFHLKYKIINENNISNPNYPKPSESNEEKLFLGNYLSCHGVFIKHDIIIENKFNENRILSGLEDWELWICLSLKQKIKIVDQYTSTLINHKNRSVRTDDIDTLINKTNVFISTILSNNEVINKYTHLLSQFKSNCYSYLSLHISLTKKNHLSSLKYLVKALQLNVRIIYSKRFWAIIKHLLIFW